MFKKYENLPKVSIVRLDTLAALVMTIQFMWYMTSCRLVNRYRLFYGASKKT